MAILATGLIVFAGLTAYANSFFGPFIYDDISSIVENGSIRRMRAIGRVFSPPVNGETVTGRPVLNLSFAINYAVGGTDPRGYHIANLAIHILNGLLLLGILRRTLGSPVLEPRFGNASWGLALAIAILWVVHPLQTESVTYVVQRAESLASLFYLLVIYAVIRGMDSKRPGRWYILAVVACLMGVATKEVVGTVPLIVLLYDRTWVGGTFRESLRRRWALYLGLAASWILLIGLVGARGLWAGYDETSLPNVGSYARSQPGVILHYLRLSFWPRSLCLDYDWPVADTLGAILPGVLVVSILGTATVWGLVKRQGWGILGAWFFLILAPTSSIMPLLQLAFEHRMYLPLAAVVTLVIVGAYQVGRRLAEQGWISDRLRIVLSMGLVMAAVGSCIFLTARRNEAYRSDLSIWEDTAAKAPHNVEAYNKLGNISLRLERVPEALEYYQQALRIRPDYYLAHNNLAALLLRLGRTTEAAEHYQQAVNLRPNSAEAHDNLGIALAYLDRTPEAIEQYQQSLKIRPDAVAHNNLGLVLANGGHLQEAIEHYEMALRIKPDYDAAHNNLGLALSSLNRYSEAIEHFEMALRIQPDYALAYRNCAAALADSGRIAEAIEHALQAVRRDPDQPQFQRYAAWLMATHNSTDEEAPSRATELAQRACALTSRQDIDCLDTLAAAYASAGRFGEAVTTAQEAWQLAQMAGQGALAEEIHMRLQLYRDQRPYREPPLQHKTGPH